MLSLKPLCPHVRIRANPAIRAACGDRVLVSMPRRAKACFVEISPRRIRQDGHPGRVTKLRQRSIQFVSRQKPRQVGAKQAGIHPAGNDGRAGSEQQMQKSHSLGRSSSRNCARQRRVRDRSRPGPRVRLRGGRSSNAPTAARTFRPSCRWRSARSGHRASRSISGACRESRRSRPGRPSPARAFLLRASRRRHSEPVRRKVPARYERSAHSRSRPESSHCRSQPDLPDNERTAQRPSLRGCRPCRREGRESPGSASSQSSATAEERRRDVAPAARRTRPHPTKPHRRSFRPRPDRRETSSFPNRRQ